MLPAKSRRGSSRDFEALLMVFLVCVATTFTCKGSSTADEEARFNAFLDSHGRRYTPVEREARLSIWQENRRLVKELNERRLGAIFSADGPFGDMTTSEFATRVLMSPKPPPTHPQDKYLQMHPKNASPLPAEKDWREDGAVTPVRDQGFLGSCWAFSTVENLEGQMFLSQGHLTPLSVEQLIECDDSTDPKQDKADCGEFGGWPYLAYEYLMRAGGIHSDQNFPYCSGIPFGEEGSCLPCMAQGYDKQECGNHSDLYCNVTTTKGQVPGGLCKDMSKAVAQIKDWKAVGPDEIQIQEQLVAIGPLSAALNAALLQFYWGGIYDPYDYWCDPKALDHAVLLVGYGTEDGKDFWTVKNSWGSSWGEDGYFRIARGSGKCGINTAVTTGFLANTAAELEQSVIGKKLTEKSTYTCMYRLDICKYGYYII